MSRHRLLPTYIAWLKRERCAWAAEDGGAACYGPIDPHHYPMRSSLGYTDDSRAAPACRAHHDRCHGATVVVDGIRRGPIAEPEQREAAYASWWRFFSVADEVLRAAVLTEHDAWRPGTSPAVPY